MGAEQTRRRTTFREGAWIRLADGQAWSFPPFPAPGVDLEYDALIQALMESEDCNEMLQCELALTILLLSRNYELTPREFEEILDFGPDREAGGAAQKALHTLIVDNHQKRFGEIAAEEYEPERGNEIDRSGGSLSLMGTWVIWLRSILVR